MVVIGRCFDFQDAAFLRVSGSAFATACIATACATAVAIIVLFRPSLTGQVQSVVMNEVDLTSDKLSNAIQTTAAALEILGIIIAAVSVLTVLNGRHRWDRPFSIVADKEYGELLDHYRNALVQARRLKSTLLADVTTVLFWSEYRENNALDRRVGKKPTTPITQDLLCLYKDELIKGKNSVGNVLDALLKANKGFMDFRSKHIIRPEQPLLDVGHIPYENCIADDFFYMLVGSSGFNETVRWWRRSIVSAESSENLAEQIFSLTWRSRSELIVHDFRDGGNALERRAFDLDRAREFYADGREQLLANSIKLLVLCERFEHEIGEAMLPSSKRRIARALLNRLSG